MFCAARRPHTHAHRASRASSKNSPLLWAAHLNAAARVRCGAPMRERASRHLHLRQAAGRRPLCPCASQRASQRAGDMNDLLLARPSDARAGPRATDRKWQSSARSPIGRPMERTTTCIRCDARFRPPPPSRFRWRARASPPPQPPPARQRPIESVTWLGRAKINTCFAVAALVISHSQRVALGPCAQLPQQPPPHPFAAPLARHANRARVRRARPARRACTIRQSGDSWRPLRRRRRLRRPPRRRRNLCAPHAPPATQ